VPEPAVPKPVVPAPVVPEPAMPEPAMPEPAMPKPAMPEPVVPEPVVRAPVMPAPAPAQVDMGFLSMHERGLLFVKLAQQNTAESFKTMKQLTRDPYTGGVIRLDQQDVSKGLKFAIQNENLEMVQWIFSDCKAYYSDLPALVQRGNVEIAKHIIDHEPDQIIRSDINRSAQQLLRIAARGGHRDMFDLLVSYLPLPLNMRGITASLCVARIDMFQYILEHYPISKCGNLLNAVWDDLLKNGDDAKIEAMKQHGMTHAQA
jgi:hypothetical protein